jgi:EAL domain-containing protein (putative c-di-GMP-specific phosphodiesterase class I)
MRPPALKPVPAAAPPPPAVVDAGPPTVESLGQQLREVLPTRRLHSVSLCDHEANVLWLSEGALGPDEHSLVVEALALLAADISLPCHELGLEDGRLALFLPVRAPTAELVGIAMIIADGKSVGDDTLERMAAAPVRAIMLRLAVLLKPAADARLAAAPLEPLTESEPSDNPDVLALLDDAAPAAAPAARRGAALMSAEEVNDILEFELTPEETGAYRIPVVQPAAAASTSATAAAASAPAQTSETSSEMMSLEFVNDSPAPPPAAPPPPVTRPAARAPAPAAAARAPTRPAVPVAAPAAPAARIAPVAPSAHAVTPRPAAPTVAKRVPARTPPPAAVMPPPAPARIAPAQQAAPPAAALAAAAAASDPNLLLEVLPYAKLRAGGQTRRFQLLSRSVTPVRDPAAYDAQVLQRLLGWLAAHRAAWNSQPTGFTVNLSIATLEDERFPQKVAAALNSHGIAGDTLGFEIAEALCTQRRAQVERFIGQCEKVGAWVVVDDFSFDAQVLPLLRSKAVRLVKIDAKLTSSALKDKLAQAMVVATVQAAKVLGIHCGAKKVDSQAALQWLTAIGCDLGQGAALAPVQALDSLAGSPDPTGLNAVLR